MKKTPRRRRRAGFALVVTLSLMILLTVVAVALLSLSTVSLRSASQSSASSIARNNARLGMMLALGELQKNMGQDTSVSAPASSIVDGAEQPHLTGVWQRPEEEGSWESWHWTPRPSRAPSYSDKEDLFKGWLVSTADRDDAFDESFPSTRMDSGANVINLVGNPADEVENGGVFTTVNAQKVKVSSSKKNSGNYAWAVFDESTKAPVNLGNPPAQTLGQEIASRSAPSRVRADILANALEKALEEPENLISLDTAVIPGGASSSVEFRKRFHDFTTNSVGLMTDTAKGGLKTDLTSIFEDGDSVANPTNAFLTPQSIGPYADSTAAVFTPNMGSPRWTAFRDLYRKHKRIASSPEGMSYRPPVSTEAASDLKININGVYPSPDTHRLLPVIAKVQIAFSIVSHFEHLSDRVQFYNSRGGGASNYCVPHLVYDPIITLYNPYDVALDLDKIRIRVWDPPVGFRFWKTDKAKGTKVPFRPINSADNDGFHGLARFQGDNEGNASARKAFTLILTNGTNAASGTNLKLLPGEVKVYSPRVEDNWSWGMETAGGYNPRAFFDHANRSNFGNVDNRSPNGIGAFGMETVPGWNGQAGLSADHLSYGARPNDLRYDFEITPPPPNGVIGAFVATKLADEITVEAKPMVAKGNARKTFQVDILAGAKTGSISVDDLKNDTTSTMVAQDRLRTYSFTLADVPGELLGAGESPIIERTYPIGAILQRPSEPKIPGTNVNGPGGKVPFAMLEMSARATKDPRTDSKPWLFNNPVVEGGDAVTGTVGMTNQSYDLRFYEISSFRGFPNGVDIDPDTFRGYFGASSAQALGSSFVQMMHVPVTPMASLGDMVHTNLIAGSALPRVTHPLGNSRAHPLIPADAISNGNMLDHSYLLNDSMWDKFYFSSITGYGESNGSRLLESRDRKAVLTGVLDRSVPALNNRLTPITNASNPSTLASTIDGLDAVARSRQLAKYLGVSGPFNLNSTSVDAWRAVLSSLRDREVNGAVVSNVSVSDATYGNGGKTPFVRMGKPLAGADAASVTRWAGYRSLSDAQISDLANSIVREIRKRGEQDKAPAFSVGEFVNRRLGQASGLHVLKGLLQTAIDNTDINNEFRDRDGQSVSASVVAARKSGVVNPDAMAGSSSEGSPSFLTQGDLMSVLAPIATVRGDTFKIRSYGEATDSGGNILARAWCEVIVQRTPDYVDLSDLPEVAPASLTSDINKRFGRKFDVVSFRWLNENEI